MKKIQKTRPRMLGEKEVSAEKKKWDKPGCCDVEPQEIRWRGSCWGIFMEAGGPPAEFEVIEVHYCHFCGQKLDSETPARK
jgi:hypothetical protein